MIDWSQMKTAEQRAAGVAALAYDDAVARRQHAYRTESDPLRFAIEFDAHKNGVTPDFTPWYKLVAEIKQRIPLPTREV